MRYLALASLAVPVLLLSAPSPVLSAEPAGAAASFRAGAFAIDISPTNFPVTLNGGFFPNIGTKLRDPLHARCIALDDGAERILICVVDSCMIPREFADAVKARIHQRIGVLPHRILISATHTHSAPALMPCHGTDADPRYPAFLADRIVEGAEKAVDNLEPARIAWATAHAPDLTFCRRWVRHPDKTAQDPFGERTARAHMNPGHQSDDVIGPTGPKDPEICILSIQSAEGRAIALLANFSQHYFGASQVSSDYFGEFANQLTALMGQSSSYSPFVPIMSAGTSGDQNRYNFAEPRDKHTLETYAAEIARRVHEAVHGLAHHPPESIAMSETHLPIATRQPAPERKQWAQGVVDAMDGRSPRTLLEVYAREQAWLVENPIVPVKLQALRIGDIAIAAIPAEVFAITGLKIKAFSPLEKTFTIELANGADGYIPPPEQHALGGYTTWPTRTACLATNAEPRIVEAQLALLEQVTDQSRRAPTLSHGAYATRTLELNPLAYWRLEEMSGATAEDSSSHGAAASLEGGVSFFLPGPEPTPGFQTVAPQTPNPFSGDKANRAIHFTGGRLTAELSVPVEASAIEFWFWNGLFSDARGVTAELFSSSRGATLIVQGTNGAPGRLKMEGAIHVQREARQEVQPRSWNHVVVNRSANDIWVYLNGELEIFSSMREQPERAVEKLIFAGRPGTPSLEGKLDEIAIYPATIAPDAIAARVRLADFAIKADGAGTSPRAPVESLATFDLEPGLIVELAAAEPQVVDPVAMAFDERGRLFVAENRGYPTGFENDPSGRIALLEDRDHDGYFETRTTYADHLHFPNGVLPWRDGIFVTDAPDLLYLQDTDGDGRADVRRVVLTGFATDRSTQLRVNDPTLGPDGWIYLAGGLSSGKVRSPERPSLPELDTGRGDVRFNPRTGEFSLVDGKSQFGLSFNERGHRFLCMNRVQAQHVVIDSRYLRRNPHLAFSKTLQDLPENRIDDLLRGYNAAAAIYPISDNLTTADSHAGAFTAACAVTLYEASALGSEHHGRVFSCDPTGNLVHWDDLIQSGATYSARRSADQSEFLRSTDNWFRPVFLATGPDDALYVCDMYRKVIEHPDYLPDEVRKTTDFETGRGMGRIYRLRSKSSPPPNGAFIGVSKEALIPDLLSSSHWRRATAQRLLWENPTSDMVQATTRLWKNTILPADSAIAALSFLQEGNQLNAGIVRKGLASPHPGVREYALKLAEPLLQPSPLLKLEEIDTSSDPDPRVRFQCALTLGYWPSPEQVIPLLLEIIHRNGDDPWTHAAALSSASGFASELLRGLMISHSTTNNPEMASLIQRTATMAQQEKKNAAPLWDWIERHPQTPSLYQIAALNGLRQLAASPSFTDSKRVPLLVEPAMEFLKDRRADIQVRLIALRFLDWAKPSILHDLALEITAPIEPPELQTTAGKLLASLENGGKPAAIDPWWAAASVRARSSYLDALTSQPARLQAFLNLVEDGRITASSVPPSHRLQLRKHQATAVRQLAERLFTSNQAPPKSADEIMATVRKTSPRPSHGKSLFKTHCASCHRLDQEGYPLGPDLFGIRNQSKEAILLHLAEPNREVTPGFEAHTLTLADGRILSGLITSRTASSLTLRMPLAIEESLLIRDIQKIESSELSLMPEGLIENMSVQEVADLLAYLKGETTTPSRSATP